MVHKIENFLLPIDHSFCPLGEKEVKKIENIIGKLPINYKDFIMNFGACMFTGYAEINLESGEKLIIDGFLGSEDQPGDIYSQIGLIPELFEKKLLVIADNMFGDLYLLALDSENIFYVASKKPDELILVSGDFFTFLDKISVKDA